MMAATVRAVPVVRPAARPAARPAPDLRVVPSRRRVARVTVILLLGLVAVLFGVTVFQTRMAENQLDLDRLDDRIAAARDTFTQLRSERAALLTPDRLMAEAVALGMEPGTATPFVSVSPAIVAQVAVSASGAPEGSRTARASALREYGEVKASMDGVVDGTGR